MRWRGRPGQPLARRAAHWPEANAPGARLSRSGGVNQVGWCALERRAPATRILPLAIYFIRSKAPRLRRADRLGIWPGIFKINEPITFGAAVIFNPILAMPVTIITLLNASVAYRAPTVQRVTPT